MNAKEKVIKAIFDEVYPVSDRSFQLITEMVEYTDPFRKARFLSNVIGPIIRSILSWKGFVEATS
jgi:hypothetical protein